MVLERDERDKGMDELRNEKLKKKKHRMNSFLQSKNIVCDWGIAGDKAGESMEGSEFWAKQLGYLFFRV